MINKKKKFCEIYSSFWGDDLTDTKQLVGHTMSGEELLKFCEHYHKENLEHSSLQHFYSQRKKKILIRGINIGLTIAALILTIVTLIQTWKLQ